MVPFIITDELKLYYYPGLRELGAMDGDIADNCLTAQNQNKALLGYFKNN